MSSRSWQNPLGLRPPEARPPVSGDHASSRQQRQVWPWRPPRNARTPHGRVRSR